MDFAMQLINDLLNLEKELEEPLELRQKNKYLAFDKRQQRVFFQYLDLKENHLYNLKYTLKELGYTEKVIDEHFRNKNRELPSTELTFGQKAVGLTFNPSGDDAVGICKQRFATLIDQMDKLRTESKSSAQSRHASIAITDIETAQMRAVKALTWKD